MKKTIFFEKEFKNKEVTIQELKGSIDSLLNELKNRSYGQNTINAYRGVLFRFLKFCKTNNIKSPFNNKNLNRFLNVYAFTDKPDFKRHVIRSLKVLADFHFTKDFNQYYLSIKNSSLTTKYQEILNQYIAQSFRSSIVKSIHRRILYKFLNYLQKQKVIDIRTVSPYDITKYINSLNFASATLYDIRHALKDFLNFTHSTNLTSFSGIDVFPVIHRNYRDRILSFYSKDEVKRLIECIDITTNLGKRDYLVMLLAATLGMRSGDIINLKLEDINWDNQTLMYTQLKTKKPMVQPFSDEVKYALLDYINNVRYDSEFTNVLIREVIPHAPYSTVLYDIPQKYFKLANIDIKNRKHGLHSLRHSLANNMLGEHISMQNISSALGHEYLSTTELYINIDIPKLKAIALEVPVHE